MTLLTKEQNAHLPRGRDANPNNLHITFTTFVVTCIVSQILCRMKHKFLHNLKTEHPDYLNIHYKSIKIFVNKHVNTKF
jgi:hypothetical protein